MAGEEEQALDRVARALLREARAVLDARAKDGALGGGDGAGLEEALQAAGVELAQDLGALVAWLARLASAGRDAGAGSERERERALRYLSAAALLLQAAPLQAQLGAPRAVTQFVEGVLPALGPRAPLAACLATCALWNLERTPEAAQVLGGAGAAAAAANFRKALATLEGLPPCALVPGGVYALSPPAPAPAQAPTPEQQQEREHEPEHETARADADAPASALRKRNVACHADAASAREPHSGSDACSDEEEQAPTAHSATAHSAKGTTLTGSSSSCDYDAQVSVVRRLVTNPGGRARARGAGAVAVSLRGALGEPVFWTLAALAAVAVAVALVLLGRAATRAAELKTRHEALLQLFPVALLAGYLALGRRRSGGLAARGLAGRFERQAAQVVEMLVVDVVHSATTETDLAVRCDDDELRADRAHATPTHRQQQRVGIASELKKQ